MCGSLSLSKQYCHFENLANNCVIPDSKRLPLYYLSFVHLQTGSYFIKIWRLHARWHVPFLIVDVIVPCNEQGLPEFNDFNGDEKRDRHHIRKEEHPSEEDRQELLNIYVPQPFTFLLVRPVHVDICFINHQFVPNSSPSGSNCTKDALDTKDDNNRPSDHLFEIGLLLLWSDRVTHDSRVMARVSHDSYDPFSVAQTGASEQQVVTRKWDFSPICCFDNTLVLVDLITRNFANNFTFEFPSDFLKIWELFDTFRSVFVFKISFTVQVFSLHEAQILGLRWCKQDKVRGEELILFHLDDLSYPQLLPGHFLIDRGSSVEEWLLKLLSLASFRRCDILFVGLGVLGNTAVFHLICRSASLIFNEVLDHANEHEE